MLTEQLNLDILRVKPFHKNQNRLEGRLMLIFNKDKDAEEAAGALNGFLWRGRNLKAVVISIADLIFTHFLLVL